MTDQQSALDAYKADPETARVFCENKNLNTLGISIACAKCHQEGRDDGQKDFDALEFDAHAPGGFFATFYNAPGSCPVCGSALDIADVAPFYETPEDYTARTGESIADLIIRTGQSPDDDDDQTDAE